MVVYADILIIVNLITDYFLLSATGWILKKRIKQFRYVVGALIGSIFSLYIFIPIKSIVLDFSVKLLFSFIVVAITFGVNKVKQFVKAVLIFFGISCAYAGIMAFLWHNFKPTGMIVKNSVVYFNISPTVFIFITLVSYCLFMVFSLIFKGSAKHGERCEIKLTAGENSVNFNALVDSGNSINDVFGNSEIIIADKSIAVSLFDSLDLVENPKLSTRYRVIPCNTVSGSDLLSGYRCDNAEIKTDSQKISIKNPVLAISKVSLDDGYDGIINPEILNLE